MKEAISCGGIVIYRGKILVLYKNFYDHFHGWVLPKGTVEPGESYEQTALREVKEEGGTSAQIVSYIGETHYTFKAGNEEIVKILYRIYFDREADEGGFSYWTGLLDGGESLETVEACFAGSEEFKSFMSD